MPKRGNTQLRALPDKSTEELSEFYRKIRIHRIKIFVLIFVIVGIVIGLGCAVFLYLDSKTYNSFEVMERTEYDDSEAAEYLEFQGNVLQYTQDGAVYSDLSGNVIWNQTYEMETPRITLCEEYLAIYEQGGTRIFIMDLKGQQGSIYTTIPIQRVSIAAQGTVAVLMEDSGTSHLRMYQKDGKQLAAGELHIENSGYPLDIALSNDAQKLAVSMLDISAGTVGSTVVFYNYGTVGQNEIDNIVGSYSYANMVIPRIRFVSNDRLLAFGDTKVLIYEGKQKPVVAKEVEVSKEIRSVYYNDNYFGLVCDNPDASEGYRTIIYNLGGGKVLEQNFNMDYTEIGFLQNDLICIRSEKKVVLYTMRGTKKFEYRFDRNVYDVISGDSQLEYLVILSGESDRIRLKDKKEE